MTAPLGAPTPTTLVDVLERAAERAPTTLAVIDGTTSWTFTELRLEAITRAQGLLEMGGASNRVALLAENSVAMVAHLYAAAYAGIQTVLLNARLLPAEQAALLQRSRSSAVVGDASLVDHLRELLPSHVTTADLALAPRNPSASLPVPPVATDPAWLLYTSGTTGISKGAVLTHTNLLAAADSARLARGFAGDDVLGLPFPLFHVAATNLLMAHLAARPVVLITGFDPTVVAATVAEHRVTALSMAPTMIRRLVDHVANHDVDLPSLRTVYYGAAPITPALLAEASAALGCDFAQGYGMTEAAGNAVFLDAAAHRRGLAEEPALLRCAGRAGNGVVVEVVDDAGDPVLDGHVGEVTLRGPQVFAGYDPEPLVPPASFTGNGGFRTGDVGILDAGVLRIVDRKKDVVITGGENVSSLAVEAVLSRGAGVAQVAVVGRPDPEWGEAIVAVVVASPRGLDLDRLRSFARAELAPFERPKEYVVVDTLPVNATGKVDKVALRAMVEGSRR